MKVVDRFSLYSFFQNKAFKEYIYYPCQTEIIILVPYYCFYDIKWNRVSILVGIVFSGKQLGNQINCGLNA